MPIIVNGSGGMAVRLSFFDSLTVALLFHTPSRKLHSIPCLLHSACLQYVNYPFLS